MDPDQHFNALNKNDMLHWYEILEILGQGGFGITYLARDTNLDQLVAIKEYLPTEFSTRDSHSTVQPISEGHTKVFDWGKMRFLDEARTLAQFRHPNVVRVHSFFENNNTGYMVMEYEEGTDLEKVIKGGESFDERRILDILLPVLDGLELIHKQGFIHRDIKPANIFIREDGSPVLIDFGSARQAIGGKTRTMTSLVTPGFAPFEQYHDAEGKQGPWTDIYSLGATCYSAITGKPPTDALKRGMARLDHSTDAYLHLADLKAGKFSDHFLLAIDHALEFKETDRPQNVTIWRSMLLNETEVPQSQIQTQLGPGALDDANDPPVEATRVEPGTTEPTRADPVADEPTRAEPPPLEPTRAEPPPAEPKTAEPAGVDSIPVESTRVQSIQVEPTRVTPIPVEPTRIEPVPAEPTRVESTKDDSERMDPANVDVPLENSPGKSASRKTLPIALGVVGIVIIAGVLILLPASKEGEPVTQASRSDEGTQTAPPAGSVDGDQNQAMLEKQQQEQARIAEEQERLKQEQARLAEEREKLEQEQARLAQEASDRQAALEQEAEQQRQAEIALEQEAEQKRNAELALALEAEKKRQAELARQLEAEKKRQAELTRQQEAERKRQEELARQKEAEKKRQAELARQQEAEEKRQAELARQKQLEEQAALAAQPKPSQPVAAPLDLTGTYVPDEGFEELVLKQSGNKITGFIGTNQSTFEGHLQGNKLVFTFMYSKTGYGHRKGSGEFAVSADGNRLTGTRKGGAFTRESTWNLTRADQSQKKVAKSNSTLTGTFVPDEGFEDLVLKQSGNKVTGFIGTNQSTFEGHVEGNRLVFTFMYSKTGYGHRKGSGEFVISADGNRLSGTRKGGSFPANSPWNLTRKQDP